MLLKGKRQEEIKREGEKNRLEGAERGTNVTVSLPSELAFPRPVTARAITKEIRYGLLLLSSCSRSRSHGVIASSFFMDFS
jgi:hypothetical protein